MFSIPFTKYYLRYIFPVRSIYIFSSTSLHPVVYLHCPKVQMTPFLRRKVTVHEWFTPLPKKLSPLDGVPTSFGPWPARTLQQRVQPSVCTTAPDAFDSPPQATLLNVSQPLLDTLLLIVLQLTVYTEAPGIIHTYVWKYWLAQLLLEPLLAHCSVNKHVLPKSFYQWQFTQPFRKSLCHLMLYATYLKAFTSSQLTQLH